MDAYTKVEAGRLKYIRSHQKSLRCDLYKGLSDALLSGETNGSKCGMCVIVPSSYTGDARYMIQSYHDAMAICKWAGYPNLFITFTCNPKWPEILRFVESRGLKYEDRPDVVLRIFKLKLNSMIKDFRCNKVLGDVVAGQIYCIFILFVFNLFLIFYFLLFIIFFFMLQLFILWNFKNVVCLTLIFFCF